MNKRIKLTILGTAVVLAATLVACTGGKKAEEKNTEEVKRIEYSYNYDDGKSNFEVTVKNTPTRAVTLSQFMTENLLALGLRDKMVATALLDNPILPQFKEQYDKIPQLKIAQGHAISKEQFISLKPDFVSGWEMSINSETTGSAEDLYKENIYPYVMKSLSGNATVDTVYEDLQTLGDIFNVQDNANKVVSQMKADIANVQKGLEGKEDTDKPKVLIYDSGEKDAMVVGGGLPNNLINLAGGKNIYGDLQNDYENVSFESIVKNNPDVILVTEFLAGEKADKKIEFLKSNPVLKDVNAIKNNKIFVIPLADLSPGIRASKAIKEMNTMFYE